MLILASASPRRRDLLTQAGLRFDVLPAHIDETLHPNESPTAYVQRLALEKAQAIHTLHPKATILGADTTVVCEQQILNKPTDLSDAERMLRHLSNRVHQVHTGIAVVTPTTQRSHVETTSVFFSAIPEDDLANYLSTGDSLDKAGAYGIQGYAARWIPRIEGDFFNVMGLPIAAVLQLLRETRSL
ncbi:nucleoside triphosphate pyrophosphatase [Granulicella sp. L46]|uniref:Maf family protein n=1 Tax=Granulicella sp. L46 TaxID=1641865 RepID=UPI00131B36E0|nr:Maf family protein [Granulicella sp. L46]